MKRTLVPLILALVPALALAAQPDPQVRALREEIAALKLDRALNLTRAQAQTLLPILQQRKQAMAQFEAQREQQRPAIIAALTKERDELRTTGTVSAQTQQAVRDAHGSFGPAMEQGRQFHDQVKSILTPQQVEAVKSVALAREGAPEMAPRGGFGGPEEMERAPGHKHGGFGKMRMLHHTITSDAFINLVSQRAK